MTSNIEINIERVERRLDDIWEIGATDEEGVTRLAYSDEETEAIEYICEELPEDFAVSEDSIGNVFATKEPNADQTILMGSHLDTVFNGGRLDGALGVVAALEAIQTAYKVDEPQIPPTLVIFRAEESSRFGQWAIGSRGALGNLTVDDFSATDQSDIPLWQAMQQQGFQPEDLSEPTINPNRIAGFLELHIEQGRVLDENSVNLGIVTSIRAPVRYRVTVNGDYDHSGATPMMLRKDAIAGAAKMITEIEALAIDAAKDEDLVATVGELTTYNGAINKVCGKASFPIDIRSKNESVRDKFEKKVLDQLESVSKERELTTDTEQLDRSPPVHLDDTVTKLLADITSEIGISYQQIPSGGGHDAMNLQHAGIPTGMLFVPSIDGISHSPEEATSQEAVEDATKVLTNALLRGFPDTILREGENNKNEL